MYVSLYFCQAWYCTRLKDIFKKYTLNNIRTKLSLRFFSFIAPDLRSSLTESSSPLLIFLCTYQGFSALFEINLTTCISLLYKLTEISYQTRAKKIDAPSPLPRSKASEFWSSHLGNAFQSFPFIHSESTQEVELNSNVPFGGGVNWKEEKTNIETYQWSRSTACGRGWAERKRSAHSHTNELNI